MQTPEQGNKLKCLFEEIGQQLAFTLSRPCPVFEDRYSVRVEFLDCIAWVALKVERVIKMARSHFDYVVIDMPKTLVMWSETVLHAAHVYFATMELDMRSAQNVLRMKRALQSEDLPFSKLRFALNRAPKFTDPV